ncbi:hypothetical protein GV791_08415 [Nocardia cyriacigeorgica]|uniref:Uncharacterized protein n=2 Tax=Nocardia cyriacigeorgica TaxID=135487 RepID=H6QZG0_NOCCG|nr:hypothetical protein [Nocardia cyriacigeorgica]MBF6080533.1 hypothetical protein [Nocardia cyriacigeorgica]MBF6288276.1 hypothetical protein [Nocardia cyriacigeorgica]MBF6423375.1 hypothetical protein [Nocardia cyriacigeorgica]NEW32582.1 hypothetical protein [Nocardia cyriacigeorgica]CCF64119.1 conserved exported protein of unknown function [Nocardia cyriacigeorgica GUH-2]
MNSIVKKFAVGASAATLIGAAGVLGAAPAQAQFPGFCSVNPVAATAAYSQCGGPVWHQVRITCWAWWSWFSSYERWGNPAWDGQQSWTSCDLPFSMQTWQVIVR